MSKNYFDMNRPQRYESVPQRDEVIILDSIDSSSYNYNTALPTSVASSAHGGASNNGRAASIISVPDSPPPSFHTHSSPGTPRPTHAQLQQSQYPQLWGEAAPSTVGGETINTSNDALGTITGLKQRVEWLEESIGRLLLEREEFEKQRHTHGSNPSTRSGDDPERANCCVIFHDPSPDVERTLADGQRTNCCVAYSGTNSEEKKNDRACAIVAALFVLGIVAFILVMVVTARSGRVNRAVNSAVDKAVEHTTKMLE